MSFTLGPEGASGTTLDRSSSYRIIMLLQIILLTFPYRGNSNATGGNSVAIGRSAGAGGGMVLLLRVMASAGANGRSYGSTAFSSYRKWSMLIGYDSETPGSSISGSGANAKSSGAR